MGSPTAGSILRQLSGKEAWNSSSTSKRWNKRRMNNNLKQMEGFNNGTGMIITRKRVMVVVDQSSSSKHAMMWALTHVANKGDVLTLLHIIPPVNYHHRDDDDDVNKTPDQRVISTSATSSDGGDSDYHYYSSPNYLANSLATLCKACKPEVEVEALVIQGPRTGTVMSQVKKLEVSVLVLAQKKPTASLISCFCGISRSEDFVEYCINNADCLTLGVRKQSKGMGGYLISTRWQKNFWLLA
ncbi:hypothetical protein MKW94_023155 [Papaver nudicaule]|uniref:UspA domain-containing protein n=1 Tax=Papaver nudicaule TaxID=74823 RepID=A0AA41S0J0_PAPNU|nr:hypothetical protein [Papaver nudicaule]